MPSLFVNRRPPAERPAAARLALLHGILGRGSNLGALARRVQARHAALEAWLLDLPAHGRSRPWPPPYTLAAVAEALEQALRPDEPPPLRLVAGHSFGGKCALQWLERTGRPPEHLVVLDANPGPRPDRRGAEGLMHVLRTLREAEGRRFPSRAAFEAQMRAAGLLPAIASWLATNLEGAEAWGLRFGLDLDAIEALLEDHFARDLWHLLEDPPESTVVHLVVGGRSNVLDEQDVARARRLAEAQPRLRLHVLPEAGHWVHVDALEPLGELLGALLASPEATRGHEK